MRRRGRSNVSDVIARPAVGSAGIGCLPMTITPVDAGPGLDVVWPCATFNRDNSRGGRLPAPGMPRHVRSTRSAAVLCRAVRFAGACRQDRSGGSGDERSCVARIAFADIRDA